MLGVLGSSLCIVHSLVVPAVITAGIPIDISGGNWRAHSPSGKMKHRKNIPVMNIPSPKINWGFYYMGAVHSIASDIHPSALAGIYQSEVAIAIWQRQLSIRIKRYAEHLMAVTPHWQTRFVQRPHKVAKQLEMELPLSSHRQVFIDDLVLVVDMFSCLFELEHVGFRMEVLSRAMCPKFHVDRVPCRLICTYAGASTEWLIPEHVERLDNGGINPRPEVVPKTLGLGSVALLKGEAWEGNEGRGLVHRSPAASDLEQRLVLTLDFAQ